MVTKLFARLERVPDYDGNPKARLIAWIGETEYRPEESLASIGLYSGKYLMMLEPGESTRCACVQPVAAGILTVERV